MSGEMPYRILGSTGEKVSIIGLGGHHIGRQVEKKRASQLSGLLSIMESISWTIAGTTTMAEAKSGWERLSGMGIEGKYFS